MLSKGSQCHSAVAIVVQGWPLLSRGSQCCPRVDTVESFRRKVINTVLLSSNWNSNTFCSFRYNA